jgi:hypothetical protein
MLFSSFLDFFVESSEIYKNYIGLKTNYKQLINDKHSKQINYL